MEALKAYGDRVVTWHLRQSRDKVWAALAKVLFDRCEPNDPVHTTISGGRPSGERTVLGRAPEKEPESEGVSVREHEGALFLEKRGFHIRLGDWIVRQCVRKYAGGAAVLAWHCPESHALLAVSTRCGAGDAQALARELPAWMPVPTREGNRASEGPGGRGRGPRRPSARPRARETGRTAHAGRGAACRDARSRDRAGGVGRGTQAELGLAARVPFPGFSAVVAGRLLCSADRAQTGVRVECLPPPPSPERGLRPATR